jgi:hypothetical protein
MTLFEQWELVNYIANKDYGGNVIEPDRFAQLVKVANIDLFKVKMGLPEDFQPGVALFRQHLDVVQRLTDETRFLHKRVASQAVTAGVVSYPTDYFGFDAMRYGYQRQVDGTPTVLWKSVESLTEDEYSDRSGNWTKKPSGKNPVCVFRSDGSMCTRHPSPRLTLPMFVILQIRCLITPSRQDTSKKDPHR